MALSGSNTTIIGGNMSLRIAWSATQNITNNTSTVTSNLYIDFTNSSLSVGSRSDAYMTIDGVNLGFTAPAVSKSGFTGSVLLGTVSKIVNHNSDGTKSLTVSGYYPIRATISGTYIASVTVTSTGTLDTIPRASTPTLSPSTQAMGSAMTITTNRASTAFTHTLKYTFGTLTGTIATGVGASYSWTIPLTFANAIPSATSGAGTITTETYNGSSLIGTTSVSFTATVPSSVVPSISSVTIGEAVSGLATKFLAYVQNKSKLTVVTAAAGAYSSTISEVKVTTLSKSYIGSTVTTDSITSAGTVGVVVLVTDSRGRTATTTTNITVQAYSSPVISSYSAYRVNGSGVASDSGTSISAPINFTISSVGNRNDKSWTLTYRVVGAVTWTSLTSGSVYTYDQTYSNLTGLFSGNNAYEIRLTVTDYFTTAEKIVSIPTDFTLLNFNASGKGLAIGKVSAGDTFEVAIPSTFTDTTTVNSDVYVSGTQRITTGNLGVGANTITQASGTNLVNTKMLVASGTMTLGYDLSTINVASFLRNGLSRISIISASANASSLFFGDTTSESLGRIQYNSSGNATPNAMDFFTSNTVKMRITNVGDVGIGTTGPAEKLDVVGNIKASGTLNVPSIVRPAFVTQAKKLTGTTMAIDYANGDYQSFDISGASAVTVTVSNFPSDRPAQMTIMGTNSSPSVGSVLTFAVTGITTVRHGTSLASTSLTMSTNSINMFVITSYKQNSGTSTISASVKML